MFDFPMTKTKFPTESGVISTGLQGTRPQCGMCLGNNRFLSETADEKKDERRGQEREKGVSESKSSSLYSKTLQITVHVRTYDNDKTL